MDQRKQEELTKFFLAIFGGTKGYIEIRTFVHTRKEEKIKTVGKNRLFREVKDIKDLVRALSNENFTKGKNIYFGVAPRAKTEGKQTGAEKDIQMINCLWSDVDCRREKHPELPLKSEKIKEIEKFDLPPSIIVDSGLGYQCYWLLKMPIPIRNREMLLEAKGVLKGLTLKLGGDVSGHDLCRILRVPFTQNHKPECPKEGLPVKIIKFFPSLKYGLELKKYMVKVEDVPEIVVHIKDIKVPPRFEELLKENKKLQNTYLTKDRPDITDQTGSGYDMALANILVKNGFTDSEIAAILKSSKTGTKKKISKAYLTLTIGKARALGPSGEVPTRPSMDGQKPITEREHYTLAELWDAKLPPEEMLIGNGLIPVKGLGMIGGLTKEGKTILGLQMALCLVSGNHFLEDFPIKKKCKIIYLNHENTIQVIDEKIKKLKQGFAEVESPIKYEDAANFHFVDSLDMTFDFFNPELGNLKKIIDEVKPEVIFLDPLSQFVGFDINKGDNIKRLKDFLKRLCNCFWMVLHHYIKPAYLTKGQEDIPPIYKLLGSSYLANMSDTFIGIQKEGKNFAEENKIIHFVLRHERTPIPMHLHRNPETLFYSPVDNISLLKGKITKEDVVEFLLKGFKGRANYTDLSRLCQEEFGISDPLFAKRLKEAKDAGLVYKEEGEKRGFWVVNKGGGLFS